MLRANEEWKKFAANLTAPLGSLMSKAIKPLKRIGYG
jgi:hypothetical protein